MKQSIRPKIIIGALAILVGKGLHSRLSGKGGNPKLVGRLVNRVTGNELSNFEINESMFLEAHWWGMEVETLTPLAKQILKIPASINGLWVDETNLWAVRCDIKAADIVLKVQGYPVKDLGEFYHVTKRLRNRRQVTLEILRGDAKIYRVLNPGPPLGIAAMESADVMDPLTSDSPVDPLDLGADGVGLNVDRATDGIGLTNKQVNRPTGKEFSKFGIGADMFAETHWWGIEAESLTPLAKQILKIPASINGLFVDETNLWAVRCDIKAADIILKIQGYPVRDLGELYSVTKRLRNRRQVTLEILRGDTKIYRILNPGPPLGIAAMESTDDLDPLTSDAPVDPLDIIEDAPPGFPEQGIKALVQ